MNECPVYRALLELQRLYTKGRLPVPNQKSKYGAVLGRIALGVVSVYFLSLTGWCALCSSLYEWFLSSWPTQKETDLWSGNKIWEGTIQTNKKDGQEEGGSKAKRGRLRYSIALSNGLASNLRGTRPARGLEIAMDVFRFRKNNLTWLGHPLSSTRINFHLFPINFFKIIFIFNWYFHIYLLLINLRKCKKLN